VLPGVYGHRPELHMVARNTYQWPVPYFLIKYYLSTRVVETVFWPTKEETL